MEKQCLLFSEKNKKVPWSWCK